MPIRLDRFREGLDEKEMSFVDCKEHNSGSSSLSKANRLKLEDSKSPDLPVLTS